MRADTLTWEEYGALVPGRTVVLPIGSMEQHGPHLPLNVDVVISTCLAERVAGRLDGIVLPTLPYGASPIASSGYGRRFPGTTSLDGHTLTRLTLAVLRETYRHGARRFLLLNGHWENGPFLVEAAGRLHDERPDARLMVVSWWDMIPPLTNDRVFAGAGFAGIDVEHAAILETSLMLHFAPDLVHWERVLDDTAERPVPYAIVPAPAGVFPASGVCYKATYSSAEKGEEIAREIVEAIARAAQKDLES